MSSRVMISPVVRSSDEPFRRYQEGSYELCPRATGPAAWEFRWREKDENGVNRPKRKVIGTVIQYPTVDDAKRANEAFRAKINEEQTFTGRMTVTQAWEHFQVHELSDPEVDRSPTTIRNYRDYFKCYVLPAWDEIFIDEIKPIDVERWLRSLKQLAPGTKAKVRNHMSCLFEHLRRWELYCRENPIQKVRQGAQRTSIPTNLELDEIRSILGHIDSDAIRAMTAVAAGSALRRSEVRGLKWKDIDFDKLWFRLKRGVLGKDTTKMKTEASKKGIPMLPELAQLLQEWKKQTTYSRDEDWVFASPYTDGKRPYWPDAALKNHIRPAAKKAGITKLIGWHTFRHSVGKLLNDNGENIKTIQEILRHANSRITLEIYVQGDTQTKRTALGNMSGIFVVPKAKAS